MVRGEKCRFGSSRGCIIVASVIIALMLATTSGQVVDDTVTDRELLLARSGSNTGANYNFAEEKTVAIDGDTLAVGSFLNTPSCAGSSDGGRTVAGCILDYRMAEQLVAWFGEYDWTFAYSGSANGWTEAAFQTAIGSYNAQPTISVAYNYQTGGSDSGAYVFGGYTTQSWSRINRCADSGNGGTGSVDACNWWNTCANQAACNTFNACSCTVVSLPLPPLRLHLPSPSPSTIPNVLCGPVMWHGLFSRGGGRGGGLITVPPLPHSRHLLRTTGSRHAGAVLAVIESGVCLCCSPCMPIRVT